MSEYSKRHGKREAPGGSPLRDWWAGYRAWTAGLDRGGRIRLRLCQALGVIALLALAITLWLRAWIRLPDVPNPVGPAINPSGSSLQGGGPDISGSTDYEGAELPEVARSGRKDGYYTFLLCGKDVVSNSTDTMILITYDTQGKRIGAVSLLRDTMVNTSARGGGQKRLNVVFARNMGDRKLPEEERVEKGMAALRTEMSRLTGVYPDFYVLVEWEAIGRLVDAVGGVEFEVPFDMDYDDPVQDLHIHQKAGLRLLDGQDAMQVVRFRKNNNGTHSLGDLGRTQIQRDFLTAVLKKCLTPEILLKLPSLAEIFMDNVNTDLTVGNILAFAQLAVGMDTDHDVKLASMPCYGVMYGGASLVCAQEKQMLELVNDGINPYLDDVQASDLQLMYKKSGGGFGVTNGTLADPAVAAAPVRKPAAPDGGAGTAADPGTAAGPDPSPGAIGAIDPGDIFPSQDAQGGGTGDGEPQNN